MNKQRVVAVGILAAGMAGLSTLSADVKMPAIFGDHMVLQSGLKISIWGTADVGEKVTVTVGSGVGDSVAGPDGRWIVTLSPQHASTTPVTVTVAGKNTLTFSDVLIGDVWVCSGQSNMEFGLGNTNDAATEIPQASNPLLRLFLVPKKNSLQPLDDISGTTPAALQGHWVICTPDNVIKIGGWNGFSAVGYFFGQEIQKTTGEPVGLIGTYWGGTPAQSWTSVEKLAGEPSLQHYADSFAKTQANYAQAIAEKPAKDAAFQADMAKWKQTAGVSANPTPAEINAAVARAKAAGTPLPPQPKAPSAPDGGAGTPSSLYNGMIAPLIPYGIKGAIWYQGESNAGQAVEYATLFPDMISDWRQRWGEGDFPFLFVQLAEYADPNPGFAQLRESQLKTLALADTGMAVAFDIGDQHDIHPKDKHDVGLRLALAARHVAYGKDLVYSGPIYDKIEAQGGAIRVSFTQTGGGLVIGKSPWTPPAKAPAPAAPGAPAPVPKAQGDILETTSTDHLIGFMIAGTDKNWVAADAKIDGKDVVVSSPQVPQPVAVRYAFLVARGNLYNQEGLPASPFRTDDWDVTAHKGTGAPSTNAPAATPAAAK